MIKSLQRLGILCLMLIATFAAKAQEEGAITATWDFGNEDVMNAVMAFSGTTEAGDVDAVEKNGVKMTVEANGASFRTNDNNIQVRSGAVFKVPVTTTGSVVFVSGFPGYSKFSIGNSTEELTGDQTYTATAMDVKNGYVAVTSLDDNNYYYKLSVTLVPPTVGTWDFGNADIMNAVLAFSGTTEAGDVDAVEKNGVKMTVKANGATFRKNNDNNIQVRSGAVFEIPVKTTNDVVFVSGYPGYSYFTIGNSTEELTGDQTYTAKPIDVKNGYVAVTSTNDNNYYYKLQVTQKPPQPKTTLTDYASTATFPFTEGTEGQKAQFGEAADYFVNSKVTYGSNLTLLEASTVKDPNGNVITTQTRFQPTNQNDPPTEVDAIRFIIQPKAGFAFTPSKVSFKTNRYGTDNGLLDMYWENPNKTTVELEKGVKPTRNSENAVMTWEKEVTGATPAEGACALLVYLYHLQNGKQIGFEDIVIEGTLNGTEKAMPVLGSFSVNGVNYLADNVFEANGDDKVGTVEVSKTEQMVSAENPITDVEAVDGEVGTITYEGDATHCVVTIPMTMEETSMNYVLNVVQKPDFTLTYYDQDRTLMGTQLVEKDAQIGEFAVDFSTAPCDDGYKVRGWFEKISGGRKYKVTDVITEDINLWAFATEIEESSTYKKYEFNLKDQEFDPEDHEAFNPVGTTWSWHDAQHGYVVKNGDKFELLVGPKADIFVSVCKYGATDGTIVFKDAKGTELGIVPSYVADSDGSVQTFRYEGEEGVLTLEFVSSGENYIHSVRIVNNAETNFEQIGQWYYVVPDDAASLLDVIDAVNGANAAKDAERAFVFIPNGVYNLKYTVLTKISGNNISFIGENMEKTIIMNTPEKEIEGLGKAALLQNTGSRNYFQDLTLKNDLDYYGAIGGGQVGGRAACLEDMGTETVCKNVTMLSYQDTYWSNNNSMKAYWEDCDIHGTVDFICGGGDVRFQNCTISLEKRQISDDPAKDGKGGRTVTAPTTTTNFGYVFDGCKVVDLAEGKGDWNLGRTWQNNPICVWLNTTLDANAANTLVKSRWTQKGMNSRDPKIFGEYNTMNEGGENITPQSNVITSYGGNFETILTADQAASFAYDNMFGDFNPKSLTEQKPAPTNPTINNDGVITWDAVDGAIMYLIEGDGKFIYTTPENTLNLNDIFDEVEADKKLRKAETEDEDDDWDIETVTIRAANAQGGFGEPAVVSKATGIKTIDADNADVVRMEVFTVDGQRINKAQRGINIVVKTTANGKKNVEKVVVE